MLLALNLSLLLAAAPAWAGREDTIAIIGDTPYGDAQIANFPNVISQIKALIHEGNVRRVVIQHQGRTVAEFPLTAGVVGAVLAPVLAAIGALLALIKECTIEVERTKSEV